MKTKKLKKILATAMVISTSTTILPVSQIAMATTKTSVPTEQDKVNASDLEIPTTVKLVDSSATEETAEYAKKLDDAGVPVLFRPFYENNGS